MHYLFIIFCDTQRNIQNNPPKILFKGYFLLEMSPKNSNKYFNKLFDMTKYMDDEVLLLLLYSTTMYYILPFINSQECC